MGITKGQDYANMTSRWTEVGVNGYLRGISLSQSSPLRHEWAVITSPIVFAVLQQVAGGASVPPTGIDRVAFRADLTGGCPIVWDQWSDDEQNAQIDAYRDTSW